MMPTAIAEEKTFDSVRDAALIKAGTHFYCQGHLGARPIEEQSDDPRYCRSCHVFLLEEARKSSSRAKWVPRIGKGQRGEKAAAGKPQESHHASHAHQVKGDIIPTRPIPPTTKRRLNMSTPPSPEKEVPLAAPVGAKKRRGPKQKNLPVGDIERWAEEEHIGSKLIAARLNEQGVEVSYKTIQRILSGERKVEQ